MQTGNISFCDKIALNIKAEEFKEKILYDLETKYNIKILNKHFEIFRNEVSLPKLTKCPYMFCLKSNGNPYFMFLTRINNVNTCIMIDKKIQQGYFLPRMIIVHMMFGDELFKDTLFDGEMIRDMDGEWVYLLNDIYVNKGNHLVDTNIVKRHNIMYSLLEKEYRQHNDLFYIQVKRIFPLNELKNVVNGFKNELKYTSRGVMFKPMFIKFKDILYNFDDSLVKQNKKNKIGTTNEFIETQNLDKQVFMIKNTHTPDIYQLYQNNKFIGNACVNTLSVSKFCLGIFKDTSLNDTFKVECTYNTKFNKWTPIRLIH